MNQVEKSIKNNYKIDPTIEQHIRLKKLGKLNVQQ